MQTREVYLDFVRGVAILLALGWHFNKPTDIWILDLLLLPGNKIGWAGVDLFFVLSGFLIGGLIFKEFQRTGSFRAGRFLIRRGFKIWPILYVYLFLLLITNRYPWETFFFQNLFHVQNYFLTPLKHLWSLAVEEHFYLFFAVGFMIFVKSKTKNIKLFAVVLPIILLVSLFLRVLAYANSTDIHSIQTQTQFRIDALAFGIFLAYLNLFSKDKFEWLSSHKIVLAIFFLSGSVFLTFAKNYQPLIVTIGYTISYLSGGAFILFCYRLNFISKGNYFVNGIAWIGIYSYAMYIYQFVMFRAIEALVRKYYVEKFPVVLEIFIKYCGAIILVVIVTKLIERPFLALREKIYPSTIKAA